MIEADTLEIHAVTLTSLGGLQVLENFINFYENKKLKVWVRSRKVVANLDIPKTVEICEYSFPSFMRKSSCRRVIVYMNGIALVRPFNSDILLFVQNILYFSPWSSLKIRGKIRKLAFALSALLMKDNDQFIVQTHYVKKHFSLRLANRIQVLVTGPNHPINTLHLHKYVQSSKTVSVANSFIYPTSPQSHKNNEKLIKVWGEVSKIYPQLPKLYLTINKSDLQKRFDSKIDDKVDFLGSVTQDQLFAHFKDKVVIFVSSSETLGLPILEALALSRPIVILNTNYGKEFDSIDVRLKSLSAAEIIRMLDELMRKEVLILDSFKH